MTLPNNILFCPTQNIYILHEFKEGPLFGSWSNQNQAKKIVPPTLIFYLTTISRDHYLLTNNILFCPTQNIYILHEFNEGPYLIPDPNQAKKIVPHT